MSSKDSAVEQSQPARGEGASLFPEETLTSVNPLAATVITPKLKHASVAKRAGKVRKTRKKDPLYRPEYAEQLLSFFDVPPFRVTEVQKKDGSITLLETASELPTFAAFARSLGVTQSTLMHWEEQYPEFAEAAKKARDLQGDILIQNSLRGNYSSSFAVFTAKNILGWTDGKESAAPGSQTVVVRWEK